MKFLTPEKGDLVRLWTVQDVSMWRILVEQKVFHADGRRVWRDFRTAYQWMIEQMNSRIDNYSGRYPIWAWTEKPDITEPTHLPKGSSGVLLEFFAPRFQVLFSEIEMWHYVLGKWYLPLSKEESYWFDLCSLDKSYSQLSSPLQEKIEKSWERIFDLESLKKSDLFSENLDIQVTLGEIRMQNIKTILYFEAP